MAYEAFGDDSEESDERAAPEAVMTS